MLTADSEANNITNVFTGATGGVPEIAKQYRDEQKVPWVVVGDENYGEGECTSGVVLCGMWMSAPHATTPPHRTQEDRRPSIHHHLPMPLLLTDFHRFVS